MHQEVEKQADRENDVDAASMIVNTDGVSEHAMAMSTQESMDSAGVSPGGADSQSGPPPDSTTSKEEASAAATAALDPPTASVTQEATSTVAQRFVEHPVRSFCE